MIFKLNNLWLLKRLIKISCLISINKKIIIYTSFFIIILIKISRIQVIYFLILLKLSIIIIIIIIISFSPFANKVKDADN